MMSSSHVISISQICPPKLHSQVRQDASCRAKISSSLMPAIPVMAEKHVSVKVGSGNQKPFQIYGEGMNLIQRKKCIQTLGGWRSQGQAGNLEFRYLREAATSTLRSPQHPNKRFTRGCLEACKTPCCQRKMAVSFLLPSMSYTTACLWWTLTETRGSGKDNFLVLSPTYQERAEEGGDNIKYQ